MLQNSDLLMNLGLPENTLAILVKRKESYFVPSGGTVLKPNDKLLIITDNQDELREVYKVLGAKA